MLLPLITSVLTNLATETARQLLTYLTEKFGVKDKKDFEKITEKDLTDSKLVNAEQAKLLTEAWKPKGNILYL